MCIVDTKLIGGLFLAALTANGVAVATDKPFTGIFQGTGRACSGALYVRSKTTEWHSTYSACERSRYEILEKDLTGKVHRIAFLIKKRSAHCRHEVVELRLSDGYAWNVNGYPSLEAFQKRDAPDWKDSVLPGREVLSCVLIKAN